MSVMLRFVVVSFAAYSVDLAYSFDVAGSEAEQLCATADTCERDLSEEDHTRHTAKGSTRRRKDVCYPWIGQVGNTWVQYCDKKHQSFSGCCRKLGVTEEAASTPPPSPKKGVEASPAPQPKKKLACGSSSCFCSTTESLFSKESLFSSTCPQKHQIPVVALTVDAKFNLISRVACCQKEQGEHDGQTLKRYEDLPGFAHMSEMYCPLQCK